jgi:YgiT-type zinc finger domain-containing protein
MKRKTLRRYVDGSRGVVITCDMCGKKSARVRHVTRSFGRRADVFLIEDVPVIVCTACGESYLTAETLREIDRLRLVRNKVGVSRRMLVVQFGTARDLRKRGNPIAPDANQVPIPDWHKKLLDERLAEYRAHPKRGRPWPQVRREILTKLRAVRRIHAVKVVRRIRDSQAKSLAKKTPEEVIAFFRAAGRTAREAVERKSEARWSKAFRRSATQLAKLADDALKDHKKGRTRRLGRSS